MRATFTSLSGLLLMSPVWAQGSAESADAAAAENFDREPVDCITASRIDRTEVIDARTILFYMRGGDIYRNRLAYDCPRLVTEKRFSYSPTTNRLCNVDHVTVLEYWGTTLQEGMSCGLGQFFPITAEEAEFLNADPEEMLENATAVEETTETPADPEEN